MLHIDGCLISSRRYDVRQGTKELIMMMRVVIETVSKFALIINSIYEAGFTNTDAFTAPNELCLTERKNKDKY